MERYPWKGNIRELENKIERALIMSDHNTISVTDLDLLNFEYKLTTEEHPLSEIEKNAIERSLFKNNGNISKTAEELGLSRASLYRRLEKYDIKNND